jgi:hypothetical protein
MRLTALAAVVWLGASVPAAAQAPNPPATPQRPGPYVIDIRGTTVSLPREAAYFPPIPSSTAVPTRGYGFEVGAHLYPLQLGPARLGIGATFVRARGTAAPGSPDENDDDDERSPTGLNTTPDVASLVTMVAPQLSLNFGSRAGWSYLSAGFGRAQLSTKASAFVDEDDADEVTAEELIEHDGRSSINVGGGARWFAKPRLAFSFDVRFHIVSAGGGEAPTPGSTQLAAAVGISIR